MKQDKIIAILSICALLTTARAHTQENPVSDPFEGFPEFAEQLMSQWGVPGLAVASLKTVKLFT